ACEACSTERASDFTLVEPVHAAVGHSAASWDAVLPATHKELIQTAVSYSASVRFQVVRIGRSAGADIHRARLKPCPTDDDNRHAPTKRHPARADVQFALYERRRARSSATFCQLRALARFSFEQTFWQLRRRF